MGVLFRKKDIPKNCAECWACFFTPGADILWCGAAEKEVDLESPNRDKDCPMEDFPAINGKIIGADHLLYQIMHRINKCGDSESVKKEDLMWMLNLICEEATLCAIKEDNK